MKNTFKIIAAVMLMVAFSVNVNAATLKTFKAQSSFVNDQDGKGANQDGGTKVKKSCDKKDGDKKQCSKKDGAKKCCKKDGDKKSCHKDGVKTETVETVEVAK